MGSVRTVGQRVGVVDQSLCLVDVELHLSRIVFRLVRTVFPGLSNRVAHLFQLSEGEAGNGCVLVTCTIVPVVVIQAGSHCKRSRKQGYEGIYLITHQILTIEFSCKFNQKSSESASFKRLIM